MTAISWALENIIIVPRQPKATTIIRLEILHFFRVVIKVAWDGGNISPHSLCTLTLSMEISITKTNICVVLTV